MNIVDQLIRDEGEKLKPYRCTAGKLTIGVGRNLDDNGIRPIESRFMLENDIAETTAELRKNLPWFDQLDDARKGVLLNMCFNLGWPRLAQFVNTLALIKSGNYKAAAKAMLQSLWAKQVGDRAVRLSKQMETGIWH